MRCRCTEEEFKDLRCGRLRPIQIGCAVTFNPPSIIFLQMPRARPAGRHPNKSTNTTIEPSKISKSSSKIIHVKPEPEPSSESSDDEGGLEDASGSLSNEDAASSASEQMEEDIDVDAPRVAQWEPDDFEANSKSGDSDTSEEDQPEEKVAGPSQVHLVRI